MEHISAMHLPSCNKCWLSFIAPADDGRMVQFMLVGHEACPDRVSRSFFPLMRKPVFQKLAVPRFITNILKSDETISLYDQ